MEAYKSIILVLLIVFVGILARLANVFTDKQINTIKTIVAKILLPVTIFVSLAFTSLNGQKFIVVAIFFGILLLGFGLGFLIKKLFKNKFAKYIPYVITVYEAGLIGYPLYTSIVGIEHLHNIVTLDIAGLVFAFSIYMTLLEMEESNQKPTFKNIVTAPLKSSPFLATVLGLIFSVSGLGLMLKTSSFGLMLTNVSSMVSNVATLLILLVVGYNFTIDKTIIKASLPVIAIRFVVQAIFCVGVIFILKQFFAFPKEFYLAVIMMMACPSSFSSQAFIKDEEGSKFMSTISSLYCVISIIVFVVLSIIKI